MSPVSHDVWKSAQTGHLETWVKYARGNAQASPARAELWNTVLAQAQKQAPLRPGERLLDIGCGLDTVLDFAEGARGFTLDSLMGDLVKLGLSPGVRHSAGSFEQMPFASGSFDRVFLMNVLDHVQDPRAGLAEIARVLRPGGQLVMSVDTYTGRRYYEKLARKWWDRRRGARTKHPWVFSVESTRALLSRSGFDPSPADHTPGTKQRRSFFTAVRR